MTYFATLNFC